MRYTSHRVNISDSFLIYKLYSLTFPIKCQRKNCLLFALFNHFGKRRQIYDSLSLLIILIIMQKLLRSRRHLQETSEKVGKLSPEKFGQGAFLDLTFTPSKLTEHVLYREATHLKKVEEESSRCRELQVANKVLQDQVEFLKRERDGIEKSLTKMIEMYKQIIAEMQGKSEERIRIIQLKFKQQIQKNIREKQEEAKFIQSEKEVVERHVVELDEKITELNSKLQLLGRNKNQVQLDLQQLQAEHKNLKMNHEDLLKKSKENQQKMKKDYDDLREEFLRAEIQWKDKLRQQLHRKDLQIEKNARLHKVELQKVENQRNTDSLLKNQQVKQLTKTFESECARMKQILNAKEKMIDNLSQDNNKQKTKIINLTREYQNQITHLSHEKNRLLEEIQSFGRENQALAHEKIIVTEELAMENEKLRELLYQSSMELEKCRSELVGLAKDNQKLVTRLKGSEEEAKTWRDSYYLNRTRPS